MNDKNTLHVRLEQARAIIAAPEMPRLKAELTKAQEKMNWLKDQQLAEPLSRVYDLDRADAKNRLNHAALAVKSLEDAILKARKEAAALERLLNSDAALTQARQSWHAASSNHIAAAKNSEAARDSLERVKSLLAGEEAKSQTAKDSQRAALLVELGLSDQTDGTTAAASAKALIGSEAKIDALKSALPEAEKKVLQSDAAMLACDDDTRQAEQSILDAKQAIAERAHAIALETYRAALLEFHGATLASTGLDGQRISLYDESSRTAFEQVAERIRAAAVIGE